MVSVVAALLKSVVDGISVLVNGVVDGHPFFARPCTYM